MCNPTRDKTHLLHFEDGKLKARLEDLLHRFQMCQKYKGYIEKNLIFLFAEYKQRHALRF